MGVSRYDRGHHVGSVLGFNAVQSVPPARAGDCHSGLSAHSCRLAIGEV